MIDCIRLNVDENTCQTPLLKVWPFQTAVPAWLSLACPIVLSCQTRSAVSYRRSCFAGYCSSRHQPAQCVGWNTEQCVMRTLLENWCTLEQHASDRQGWNVQWHRTTWLCKAETAVGRGWIPVPLQTGALWGQTADHCVNLADRVRGGMTWATLEYFFEYRMTAGVVQRECHGWHSWRRHSGRKDRAM